jgi:hypothetical protein
MKTGWTMNKNWLELVCGLASRMSRCFWLVFLALGFFAPVVHAQETVCARVKIEIKQELTLERQAFEQWGSDSN